METMLYVVAAWLLGVVVGYLLTKPQKKTVEAHGSVDQMIPVQEVEEIHSQLSEHFADRFEPDDAVNRATDTLSKYYLNVAD